MKVLTKQEEIHLFGFFVLCFTVSGIRSMNTFESWNDFMILIISFISSFEIYKIIFFSALTAPFPLIFLSNLFIVFDAKLLTNLGKLSLAKGIAIFASIFFLNYLTKNQKLNLIELF